MVSTQDVRCILRGIEALSGVADGLGEDDDLFARGLDSFGSVQLMLALEERFGVEFPDHLLNRRSFASLRAVRETVSGLMVEAAA